MPPYSDEELMVQYQQGDLAAFDLLYLRYENKIYAYLLRFVRDRERAAELFQETFLHLHSHRHRYDAKKPLSAWAFRIARNLAYNEIRRLKRRNTLFAEPVEVEAQADHQQKNPEEAFHTKLLRQQIDTVLASLPEEQREAILLSYYGGLKYAEIAEVMETTQDAIKQRVRRGMAALRERVKSFFPGDIEP